MPSLEVLVGVSGNRNVSPRNREMLRWWKKKKQMPPILAGAAQEGLGIPCSSAKYERMYSVGGRNITQIRNSIKPKKVEHLIVSAENRTKAG